MNNMCRQIYHGNVYGEPFLYWPEASLVIREKSGIQQQFNWDFKKSGMFHLQNRSMFSCPGHRSS